MTSVLANRDSLPVTDWTAFHVINNHSNKNVLNNNNNNNNDHDNDDDNNNNSNVRT